MNVKMPVGVEDFKEARENYYLVDKTAFIKSLIDHHAKVTLFTRPRRFGKTLTLSMLDYFFSIEKKEASRGLFDSLSVGKAGEKYGREAGQYPVLFLSFKNIAGMRWENMLGLLRMQMSDLFVSHKYLLDSPAVDETLKTRFREIAAEKSGVDRVAQSLTFLMHLMRLYYGKQVVLLVDEYDAPVQWAWERGYYDECIAFIRIFLGSALKTNPDLDFAVLTGVLRIAKESIFSGLNNLEVSTVTGSEYADVFGFTEEEVRRMGEDLGRADKLPELKHWYDGYDFGGKSMYNPWSVISYFKNNCQPRPYWVNTSSNDILRKLLARAGEERIGQIHGLLTGKTLNVTLNENVIYNDIGRDKSSLFTMLLTTGYLTIAGRSRSAYDRFALRIPNEEVRLVYSIEILNHLARGIDRDTFDTLFDALLDGDGRGFERELSDILLHMASTFDTAGREVFYHGFLLGMTALMLGKDYAVKSNGESGYGRYDLALIPTRAEETGVLMEFKVADTPEDLPSRAQEALAQIGEKRYAALFDGLETRAVWEYGIAFCGKHVKVLAASR